MIIVEHIPGNSFSEDVVEKLQDLVVAHKVRKSKELRVLEGDKEIRGEAEIRSYLDELEREINIGLIFQSDTCNIDPENGTVC